MERIFVPYVNEKPFTVNVKGHKVLIVSEDDYDIRSLLPQLSELQHNTSRTVDKLLSNAEIRDLEGDDPEQTEFIVSQLAAQERAHVVVAPEGESLMELMNYIEANLPWVQ